MNMPLPAEGASSAPTHFPNGGLSPPAWSPHRCGVGFDGETGCRVCVESCPYEAIRPLNTPAGMVIHIDPGVCQRCGLCTSACPSSALERAFMPDEEIDSLVADALARAATSPVVVFAHEASRDLLESLSPTWPVAVITLPSLLILNETHLLHALRCGARGVAIVGHPAGHHFAPHLFESPLRLARAALAPEDHSRLLYIEDDGEPARVEFAHRWLRLLAKSATRVFDPAPRLDGSHRQRFAAFAATSAERFAPADRMEQLPFGEVAVEASGCTLCGACSRVCPTAALEFYGTEGRLDFKGIDCIGCGLCEQACPEQVLTLTPGLRLAPTLFERRTLVEDEVAPCGNCGDPHMPKRLLEHARRILSAATGTLSASTRQIELCPNCRSVTTDGVPARSQRTSGCGNGNCSCDEHGHRDRELRAREPVEATGLSRRSLFGNLAVTIGGFTALASGKAEGAALAGGGPSPPQATRLGMVIDLQRCIGCHACTAACKAENNVPLGVFRDWVEEHVLGEYPHARPYFLPKLCNQCSDPGCLRACPTGAIHMRADGIVDLNHGICIGCRACNQACPYGATFMDPVRGTADKCNFCAHRVDEGLNPACVDICPTSCRIFGDLDDPQSAPSIALRGKPQQALRQELGLGPNVRYLGLPAELDR